MSEPIQFESFRKIPRWSRSITITEKIDGTNAQIRIMEDDGSMLVGSRNRWITPDDDNYGFARWARENEEELRKLGPGSHFGEWWGSGIQRRYGMQTKAFSLFNVGRWGEGGKDVPPACCRLVPLLYHGPLVAGAVEDAIEDLRSHGSRAAPGFMNPEGIVIYHSSGGGYFKKTIEKDDEPKSKVAA